MGNSQTTEANEQTQPQNNLQNYRIDYENIIKRGSFCCLYKGYGPDNSTIAIKEFYESKDCAAKIKSDLNALKGFRDPNVVQILDFGEIDKKFLIATEYCNDSLDNFRTKAKNNKVNLQDIVNIGKQIGNGIRAMVNFGVIFNNLHMKNILIGQGPTVKISLPSIKTSSSWQSESFGSSYYIAPEIWFDQCGSGQEDQQNALMFSIGAILLHLAVGDAYPFKCPNTPDIHIQNIFNGVPVELRGIFLELLKKNPAERTKLKKFCVEIRGFSRPQLKQKKLFDKQHVVPAIQDPNKSTTKAENTVVSHSKWEGMQTKYIRPVTDGVSTPGERKRGRGDGEYGMVAIQEIPVKNTGKENTGHISTGHPVVLAVQNESKAIALHYQGTAKVDEDHTGPTKRIKYVRDGHESVYDVSENPKSSTML